LEEANGSKLLKKVCSRKLLTNLIVKGKNKALIKMKTLPKLRTHHHNRQLPIQTQLIPLDQQLIAPVQNPAPAGSPLGWQLTDASDQYQHLQ